MWRLSTKTWEPVSYGNQTQVLAFGTIKSRVLGFDFIVITNINCFLFLSINCDAMCIASLETDGQTIRLHVT